jgi:hypothetical protein
MNRHMRKKLAIMQAIENFKKPVVPVVEEKQVEVEQVSVPVVENLEAQPEAVVEEVKAITKKKKTTVKEE